MNIYGLPSGELVPGKMYFVRDYEGVCDNCGAKHLHPHLPLAYVGENDAIWGQVHTFLVLYWFLCPSCGLNIEALKFYFGGIKVSIDTER